MSSTHECREKLRQYIEAEARPVEKFGHQPRLYAMALKVAAGQDFDDDVLFAAVWLHDLGVFEGHRPADVAALAGWDHVQYAIDRAPGILMNFGFPADKTPAVLAAIRAHLPSSKPATVEGIILRDADILEQLGAIGILRTAAKTGRDTRFNRFTDVVASLRQALRNLPGQIQLDTARALAEPKIRALELFLNALDEEAQPGLF
jgi:uncharacterized protein